jgi:FKBP-type peptidyl-prolyl cis-trans isomerase FklB
MLQHTHAVASQTLPHQHLFMRALVVAALVAVAVAAVVVAGAEPAYNLKFLSSVVAGDPLVTKFKSGMLVKVLKKGDGAKSPRANDQCLVHYTGWLKDLTTKFDSSVDRGQPASFAPSGVIRGWTEALQKMAEGDKWRIWLPSELAYGAHGSPPRIPANSVLVFDVELLKVQGGGKPAAEARAAFEAASGKSYDSISA